MPRTPRVRSFGDDVKFPQERLNVRPTTTRPLPTPDVKFGAAKRARAQKFQGNHALSVDGGVEPSTWGSLADLGAGIAGAVYGGLGPAGGAR